MASLNTPHILVIGGTGFIGHHLLKAVHHKYWEVTSVSCYCRDAVFLELLRRYKESRKLGEISLKTYVASF